MSLMDSSMMSSRSNNEDAAYKEFQKGTLHMKIIEANLVRSTNLFSKMSPQVNIMIGE